MIQDPRFFYDHTNPDPNLNSISSITNRLLITCFDDNTNRMSKMTQNPVDARADIILAHSYVIRNV